MAIGKPIRRKYSVNPCQGIRKLHPHKYFRQ